MPIAVTEAATSGYYDIEFEDEGTDSYIVTLQLHWEGSMKPWLCSRGHMKWLEEEIQKVNKRHPKTPSYIQWKAEPEMYSGVFHEELVWKLRARREVESVIKSDFQNTKEISDYDM